LLDRTIGVGFDCGHRDESSIGLSEGSFARVCREFAMIGCGLNVDCSGDMRVSSMRIEATSTPSMGWESLGVRVTECSVQSRRFRWLGNRVPCDSLAFTLIFEAVSGFCRVEVLKPKPVSCRALAPVLDHGAVLGFDPATKKN